MRNVTRGLYAGAFALTLVTFLSAQTTTAPAAPTTPATPAPTTPTVPAPVPTVPTTGQTSPGTGTQQNTVPPRPIFVRGRVIMHDGSEVPERVTIERLCSTNSVRPEGYTDSKGYFSFQLGQSQITLVDASTQFAFDPTNPNGLSTSSLSSASGRPAGNTENPFWDCELRGRLPGYRSTSVLLAGRKPMDNPDIGQIVLYPLGKVEGSAVSMTSALAPKDAKKALEKGLNAVKKKKTAEAETEFRKAVALYPKYAEAWMELGKLLMGQKQYVDARDALGRAVVVDPRYVFPYEQLYMLAFEEGKWQELADTTDRLLRLNPYDFLNAFYFNGVANLALNKYDEAEKSLREAMGMDFRNANPKTHYVLGLVLVQQKNYTEAAEQLRGFAKLAPKDDLIPKVTNMLFQLDQAIQSVPPERR